MLNARRRYSHEPSLGQILGACATDFEIFHSHFEKLPEGRSMCGVIAAFELGRNQDACVVIVTKTLAERASAIDDVLQFFADNPHVSAVFPRLPVPVRAGTATLRLPGAARLDPPVRAVSIGEAMFGARVDAVICLGFDPEALAGASKRWFETIVKGRMVDSATVILCGTPTWDPPRPSPAQPAAA